MAKPKSRNARATKPKTERTKANGKGPKPAKLTPEALSDQQRQTLLFAHKRKIEPLLKAEADAKTAVTKAFEIAKKEGIPKKDLKLAIQLTSDVGIEAAKLDVERTHRIARWLGIGKQLDLFGEKETQAQRHFEDGRRAALNDMPARPPAHLVTKDSNTWLEGHTAGRASLNAMRAEGFRNGGAFQPLGKAVTDLMDQAGVTASIESGAGPVEPETENAIH